MYFYDPYGPRSAGRFYRLEDDAEPIYADTDCQNVIFAPEIGEQVYEGYSPLDLIGTKSKNNIVMNGISDLISPVSKEVSRTTEINLTPVKIESSGVSIPQTIQTAPGTIQTAPETIQTAPASFPEPVKSEQNGEKNPMLIQEQPKIVTRQAITDQFSDSRINSIFVDTEQTSDDGIEHPGYTASDDSLAPEESTSRSNGSEFYGTIGSGSTMSKEVDNKPFDLSSTNSSDSDRDIYEEYEEKGEKPKKSGIPTWLIIGGIGLAALFIFGRKNQKSEEKK
jgi:hypothetical protein